MWKQLIALAVFGLLTVSSPAQVTKIEPEKGPADREVSPEVINRKNPVPPSEESIAEGKRRFGIDCVMCHGVEGDGKGELAVSMKLNPPPPNYRDDAVMKKFTDGELFDIITNGRRKMPPEGKRATPEQIWNLINYVRTFAQKGQPPAAK